MANSKIPGPIGTYPIRIDSGTLSRTNMPQPGVIGAMNQASYAKVDHAKRALAIDIGQLILDITGIFDPSPISDGTNMLISLARGNWGDAVVSAVSIAPYIGDLSKTAKLPRYIKSVREAIRIAKFDAKWSRALRTLFTKLTKVLDECIKLAADVLPNSAKTQLKELKYEVDKFLDPIGGTTSKLADRGKKADLRPGSNSTKSQRNIDRAKPPEKLDKKPEKGYDSNKNNGPKTTRRAADPKTKPENKKEANKADSKKGAVFSGHGSYELGSGITTVPEGTSMTVYSKFGSTISDPLGNVVETGGNLTKVYKRTYGPGERMPNYTLHPPDDLDIKGSPTTVAKSTEVSDLLEPDMGECHWAACTWNPKSKNADIMYSTGGVIDTKNHSNWEYIKIYEKD